MGEMKTEYTPIAQEPNAPNQFFKKRALNLPSIFQLKKSNDNDGPDGMGSPSSSVSKDELEAGMQLVQELKLLQSDDPQQEVTTLQDIEEMSNKLRRLTHDMNALYHAFHELLESHEEYSSNIGAFVEDMKDLQDEEEGKEEERVRLLEATGSEEDTLHKWSIPVQTSQKKHEYNPVSLYSPSLGTSECPSDARISPLLAPARPLEPKNRSCDTHDVIAPLDNDDLLGTPESKDKVELTLSAEATNETDTAVSLSGNESKEEQFVHVCRNIYDSYAAMLRQRESLDAKLEFVVSQVLKPIVKNDIPHATEMESRTQQYFVKLQLLIVELHHMSLKLDKAKLPENFSKEKSPEMSFSSLFRRLKSNKGGKVSEISIRTDFEALKVEIQVTYELLQKMHFEFKESVEKIEKKKHDEIVHAMKDFYKCQHAFYRRMLL